MGWEGASKILYQWLFIIDVIIVPQEHHRLTYQINVLLEKAEWVRSCISAQVAHQPYILEELI